MAIPTQNADLTGNAVINDANIINFDAQAGARLATTASPYVVVSSVSPPTFSAPKGTLCLSTAGSGIANRLYINTNGTTGWTSISTAT